MAIHRRGNPRQIGNRHAWIHASPCESHGRISSIRHPEIAFFRRLRGALWPDGPLRAATTLDRAISLIWRRLMSFCIRGNPSSMRHIKSWQHSSQLNSRHLVHTPMIKSALRHLSTCKARANDTDTDPSPTTQLTHQHRKANMQTRSNLVRV